LFIPLVAVLALAALSASASANPVSKGSLSESQTGSTVVLTGCGYKPGYAVSVTITDSTGVSQSIPTVVAGRNCVTVSVTLAPGAYSAHATQDTNGGLYRINYPTLVFSVA
jgi:uncharacterized protein (DUF2141 family)